MHAVELTWRGASLLALGAGLLLAGLLGAGWPETALAGSLLLTILATALGYAKAAARALDQVVVERRAEPRRAVDGGRVRVTVRLVNRGPAGLPVVEVRDPGPPRCRPQGFKVSRLSLDPHATTETVYHIVPSVGRHDFPPLEVAVGDPLGLWVHVRRYKARETVYAAPWTWWVEAWSRSRLGASVETHPLLRGRSLEFYELRDYQPGDDPRRIVWTATARAGRLVVREDLPESSMRLHVFLDLSLESWVGDPGETPGDYIARLAASLLRLASRAGGRAGHTILYGTNYRILHPTSPGEALRDLLQALSAVHPGDATGRASLAPVLRRTGAALGWGLLVVLLGPGALRDELVDTLELIRGRLPARLALLVVTPGGSGVIPDTVYAIERHHYSKHSARLARLGVTASVARGRAALGAVEWLTREVGKYAAW